MPTGHPHPPRTWHNVAVPQVPMHTKKSAQKVLPVDASRTGEAPPLGSAKDPPVDASRTGGHRHWAQKDPCRVSRAPPRAAW